MAQIDKDIREFKAVKGEAIHVLLLGFVNHWMTMIVHK